MSSSTLAAPRDRDKPDAADFEPPARWRVRVAAAMVVVVATASAAQQLWRTCGEAARGPSLPAAAADRYRELTTELPRGGAMVDVLDGVAVPLVGYVTDPTAFRRYDASDARDADLSAEIALAGLRYGLAQQALAPRVLVLAGTPLFDLVHYVVGDFGRASAVPSDDTMAMTTVWSDGNGLVLWRRP